MYACCTGHRLQKFPFEYGGRNKEFQTYLKELERRKSIRRQQGALYGAGAIGPQSVRHGGRRLFGGGNRGNCQQLACKSKYVVRARRVGLSA